MPTRREDALWPAVHQRSMHLRALLDSLPDIDLDIAYELDYYPYAEVALLRLYDDAPPAVISRAYVQANRQWEYHSEFALRVVSEALRLVNEYLADSSVRGALAVGDE